jgi:hypothetical protein
MPELEKITFPLVTGGMSNEQRIELLEKQILIVYHQQQNIAIEIDTTLKGIEKLEKRFRLLERANWVGIGIILVVEFLFRSKLLP